MTAFRIEFITGMERGMVGTQVVTDPGGKVIASSGPVYHSREEAEAEVTEMIRRAWPDKAPLAVDHSIGV